ncbi:LOW QUALITY PROTEIN: vacuolar protein sorting-associated protein 33B [Haliaeetus albicilla]|uniref:LOW QUALITY PROTEIN: vacuolar protein sorting-associated protein 33B n=3 Tax=Accipitrinae TaxID=8955 RepID=UPI0037E80C71
MRCAPPTARCCTGCPGAGRDPGRNKRLQGTRLRPPPASSAPAMGSDAARLLEAADFAAGKHKDQRRKDPEGTPFINHPIGRPPPRHGGRHGHRLLRDRGAVRGGGEARRGGGDGRQGAAQGGAEAAADRAGPRQQPPRQTGQTGRQTAQPAGPQPLHPARVVAAARAGVLPVGGAGGGRSARDEPAAGGRAAAALRGARRGLGAAGLTPAPRPAGPGRAGSRGRGAAANKRARSSESRLPCCRNAGHFRCGVPAGFRRAARPRSGVPGAASLPAAPRRPAMAFAGRRDVPEPPDFGILKRLARDQLIYLLEQLPGKKDLFIEADLMSPLDRIANVSILKQHEVDKLYKVESRPVISASDQFCFLVRPRIKTMRYIADIVNADKMSGRSRKYKIIFSPQKFYACEMVLEEEGVFGDVTCDEWSFYLLPLDEDIISMELPEFFRDYFLEGDHRWINSVARALQLLNSLYGPFGKAYGIGRCAKMSYELWRDLEEESEADGQGRKPEIGNVFLMDRDTDYVTALCSQVVYEGLVDDTFRIKCGSVDFGPDVTSSDKSIKVLLNAQDKVFSQIRNEHFSSVFGFLSQKSRNLQAQYDRRRGMDIKQMKNFVSQELKGLKQEHRLLSLHIGACESIMKKKTKQDFQEMIKAEHSLLEGFDIRESTSFIEEHIDRQVSPIESLRLMCLLSITENGLIPKDYRSLKTQYLQSYGPEHLLTFHNLKRIGLLTEQSAGETLTAVESKVSKLVTDRAAGKITDAFNSLARKSNFRAISKKLGLIPRVDGEYDLKMPRDMAYVFSGAYVPLSCKIIEQVLERRGWLGLEEVVRLLNGNEFSVSDSAVEDNPAWDSQRVILAVFLGGCTFSEIAALRFLGKERGCKFIFLTTAITNSARMMEAMIEAKA